MAETPLIHCLQTSSGINATVIVLDPGNIRRTATGSVLTMRIADASGTINCTIMNPDFNETWRAGDILKIRGAHTQIYQGSLVLYIGRNGDCKKAGEFGLPFNDQPDISQMAQQQQQNVGANPNRGPQSIAAGRGRPTY
ncbi:unnamed protein product [Caenorhabditis bovis]|uniref:OB domain-containing protein n=1 Tax=Caenorhabditis bovis TaxID=2654633 RepID=A0A8S1FAW6_9PELO|nr:unnamed protein product [Caenorhabditis bovis]